MYGHHCSGPVNQQHMCNMHQWTRCITPIAQLQCEHRSLCWVLATLMSCHPWATCTWHSNLRSANRMHHHIKLIACLTLPGVRISNASNIKMASDAIMSKLWYPAADQAVWASSFAGVMCPPGAGSCSSSLLELRQPVKALSPTDISDNCHVNGKTAASGQ